MVVRRQFPKALWIQRRERPEPQALLSILPDPAAVRGSPGGCLDGLLDKAGWRRQESLSAGERLCKGDLGPEREVPDQGKELYQGPLHQAEEWARQLWRVCPLVQGRRESRPGICPHRKDRQGIDKDHLALVRDLR